MLTKHLTLFPLLLLTGILFMLPATLGGCSCSNSERPASAPEHSVETQADRVAEDLFTESGAPHPRDYSFPGKVLDKKNAAASVDVFTESTLRSELDKRGLENIAVYSDYDMQGNYASEKIDDGHSMHPMFYGFYSASNGNEWLIVIAENQIMASPIDAGGLGEVQPVLCDKDYMTVYNGYYNEFIVGVPDGSSMSLQKVEHVDARTLDKYKFDGND